jgi:hypothetical protein
MRRAGANGRRGVPKDDRFQVIAGPKSQSFVFALQVSRSAAPIVAKEALGRIRVDSVASSAKGDKGTWNGAFAAESGHSPGHVRRRAFRPEPPVAPPRWVPVA